MEARWGQLMRCMCPDEYAFHCHDMLRGESNQNGEQVHVLVVKGKPVLPVCHHVSDTGHLFPPTNCMQRQVRRYIKKEEGQNASLALEMS